MRIQKLSIYMNRIMTHISEYLYKKSHGLK